MVTARSEKTKPGARERKMRAEKAYEKMKRCKGDDSIKERDGESERREKGRRRKKGKERESEREKARVRRNERERAEESRRSIARDTFTRRGFQRQG